MVLSAVVGAAVCAIVGRDEDDGLMMIITIVKGRLRGITTMCKCTVSLHFDSDRWWSVASLIFSVLRQ